MPSHNKHIEKTLNSLRRREAIAEIQRLVAKEIAKEEPPKDLPLRLADLARELHRKLRESISRNRS